MTPDPIDPVVVAKLIDAYRTARAAYHKAHKTATELRETYYTACGEFRRLLNEAETAWYEITKLGGSGFHEVRDNFCDDAGLPDNPPDCRTVESPRSCEPW